MFDRPRFYLIAHKRVFLISVQQFEELRSTDSCFIHHWLNWIKSEAWGPRGRDSSFMCGFSLLQIIWTNSFNFLFFLISLACSFPYIFIQLKSTPSHLYLSFFVSINMFGHSNNMNMWSISLIAAVSFELNRSAYCMIFVFMLKGKLSDFNFNCRSEERGIFFLLACIKWAGKKFSPLACCFFSAFQYLLAMILMHMS